MTNGSRNTFDPVQGAHSLVDPNCPCSRKKKTKAEMHPGSAHDLTPLVWRGAGGVGRGAGEQWPGGRWGPTGFPGCQRVGGPPLSALICGPDGGKTPRKGVEKAVFSKSTTWIISAQLLYQHRVKPTVASHESQGRNRRKSLFNINLRRKHGSPNLWRNRKT